MRPLFSFDILAPSNKIHIFFSTCITSTLWRNKCVYHYNSEEMPNFIQLKPLQSAELRLKFCQNSPPKISHVHTLQDQKGNRCLSMFFFTSCRLVMWKNDPLDGPSQHMVSNRSLSILHMRKTSVTAHMLGITPCLNGSKPSVGRADLIFRESGEKSKCVTSKCFHARSLLDALKLRF